MQLFGQPAHALLQGRQSKKHEPEPGEGASDEPPVRQAERPDGGPAGTGGGTNTAGGDGRGTSTTAKSAGGNKGADVGWYHSLIHDRFYAPGFSRRMVTYAARSPAVRDVLGDLVLGTQGYSGLKRRLLLAGPRFLLDSARARLRGRL